MKEMFYKDDERHTTYFSIGDYDFAFDEWDDLIYENQYQLYVVYKNGDMEVLAEGENIPFSIFHIAETYINHGLEYVRNACIW